MPLHYRGVLAEHRAVRAQAGVFDVSHLGRLRVAGPGATELLRHSFCNDASAIQPGRAQYTMALNADGGVEDDIIVWRWDEEEYWVLPNGVNYGKVMGALQSQAPPGVEVDGLQDETVFLAVQGPTAPDLLETVMGWRPGRFRVQRTEFMDSTVWGAGTGYTGEPGGEVALLPEAAPELFNGLLASGAEPCGLGARDTLRLEMGYPLWGQDLDPDTTPLEAGFGWVVSWEHEFVGRQALLRQQEEGPGKALVGFSMEGRAIARHGHRLRGGGSAGTVASGNYSPTLGHGIGMGFLSPPPPEGLDELEVEVRDRWLPARRVEPPFVER